MLWWCIRVFAFLFVLFAGGGTTLCILFHSLFPLPLINILFKQPANTPPRRYVHKSYGADQHNRPHSWKFSSPLLSPRLPRGRRATRDVRHFGAQQQPRRPPRVIFIGVFCSHSPSCAISLAEIDTEIVLWAYLAGFRGQKNIWKGMWRKFRAAGIWGFTLIKDGT